MSRLLDPKKNGRYPFKYRPAARTNLAARFRLELRRLRRERLDNATERAEKVSSLPRRKVAR